MLEELVIGTKNPAKLRQIGDALTPLSLNVRGLGEFGNLPEVSENGQIVIENAVKKAVAYAKVLSVAVLSMDNALFLDGLSEEEQPGMNVRRIKGRSDRPTDEELLEYYSKLIKGLGDRINGRWDFGVCVAWPTGKLFSTIIQSPRIFVSTPCKRVVSGYPLESLQIDPDSGRFVEDLSAGESAIFWQKNIGERLCKFVSEINF